MQLLTRARKDALKSVSTKMEFNNNDNISSTVMAISTERNSTIIIHFARAGGQGTHSLSSLRRVRRDGGLPGHGRLAAKGLGEESPETFRHLVDLVPILLVGRVCSIPGDGIRLHGRRRDGLQAVPGRQQTLHARGGGKQNEGGRQAESTINA
jgi:hypothetical protein